MDFGGDIDLTIDGNVSMGDISSDITFSLGCDPKAEVTFTNIDGKLDMIYDPDNITEAAEAFIDWLKNTWKGIE